MGRQKTSRAATTTKRRSTPVPAPAPGPAPFVPPYRRSWFDHLTAAVDRLPGPYWAPYVVAFLAYLGLVAAARWRDGQLVTPEDLYSNSLPFYGFWLIHYLNRRAAASLKAFRPAFTGNEAELQEVHWQLTTLPVWPAAIVSLVALLAVVLPSLRWSWATAIQVVSTLSFYATLVFAGLYAYHSVRQLRLVTSLYAGRTLIDIHNVAPLYSFAILSAHTAIGMLLVLSAAVLITPAGLTGWWLVASVAFGVLAVLTFLLPLTGLHRRLVEVKEEELLDNNRRWQACTVELYLLIDRGDLASADRLNGSLAALERSRTALERIPTWPWRAETLRNLVGAVLLPVILSAIQYALKRWLG